jgi:hypothetical protein
MVMDPHNSDDEADLWDQLGQLGWDLDHYYIALSVPDGWDEEVFENDAHPDHARMMELFDEVVHDGVLLARREVDGVRTHLKICGGLGLVGVVEGVLDEATKAVLDASVWNFRVVHGEEATAWWGV